jgi:hypothetical protein
MSIIQLDIGDGGNSGGDDSERVIDLRHRSADSLQRAYDFLQGSEDVWAKLRSRVLCQACPAEELTEAIAGVQLPDGSLPPSTLISGGAAGFPTVVFEALEPGPRSIVGTLEGLLMAADAKQMHGAWVERAAEALVGLQSADGAFRVPVCIDGTGDRTGQTTAQADVFWTGMVAGVLGQTPVSRPSLLEAAGEFLESQFEPESVEQDGFSALLSNAHFFTNVAHEFGDEALQWCGRALEKGFRSRQTDAVSTVRVLLTCDAQALPGATFDVTELLESVLAEQAGDGGFAELSVGGVAARTSQTFDAMLAIVRLCGAIDA